uniref:ATP synthase complex subunit 8 n=1 Tax=Aphodius foetens TaxID=207149 RepID=A0A343C238_9SCAR|nr:ATP synthase F0 subunit 8 [Aphodius foetens]
MAPMGWLTLFLIFCTTFMIFNSLNYYSFMYHTKLIQFKKAFKKLTWKW